MPRGFYSALFILIFVGACASSAPSPRHNPMQYVIGLIEENGWVMSSVPSRPMPLTVIAPARRNIEDVVYVYVEGDGAAWRNRSTPSSNPTPYNPLAFKLAIRHAQTLGGGVAYLARPCQYRTNDPICVDNKWWTTHRFAPDVIAATNDAVTDIKKMYGASRVVLVGYSGGGAVVTLVAARRDDVAGIITVAGNLDVDAWTQHHKVSPLSGSMNPAAIATNLRNVPQYHLVGADDKIVPELVARSYQSASGEGRGDTPIVQIMDGYDHVCCWVENWGDIIKRVAF